MALPQNTLNAKSIKTTIVLDPAEVAKLPTPDGQPRCIVRIAAAGRVVTADLNAKSLRKTISAIRENPEGFAVILQGKLGVKDEILEAGLSAQPRMKSAEKEAV